MAVLRVSETWVTTPSDNTVTSLTLPLQISVVNNATILRIVSKGPRPANGACPSSVTYAGTGVFTLIKSINMGSVNISFWAAVGLPIQGLSNITMNWSSPMCPYAVVTTYTNAYQGGLPGNVQSAYAQNTSAISVDNPDTDNLACICGVVFGGNLFGASGRITGIAGLSLSGNIYEYITGDPDIYNVDFYDDLPPSQPQIDIPIVTGVLPNLGIATIVIEEYGWIAPNPLPFPIVCPYFEGGFVRKMVSTLSDLWAIEGQAADIVQDGNVSVDSGQIVTNGQVTLTNKAAVAHVGLHYNGTIKLLPLGGDGQDVNQGKERKLFDVVLRVWSSLGGTFGADDLAMMPLPIPAVVQTPNMISDPLYTGDIHGVGFESKWDSYCMPVFIQNQPLPFTLLATIIRSEISEDK